MTQFDWSSPLQSTFVASGQSPAFQVSAGQGFDISLWGTFGASVALERSFDGGALWLPVTYPDGTAIAWTGPASTGWEEPGARVLYRLNCTWTSGTVNYRVSQ